jgi:putative restriction endonuclease
MAGRDWSEVVEEAVRRHVDSTGDSTFTRQELMDSEMNRIVSETGSEGATPHQTLSRELQQLRDVGVLEFVDDRGAYRLIG